MPTCPNCESERVTKTEIDEGKTLYSCLRCGLSETCLNGKLVSVERQARFYRSDADREVTAEYRRLESEHRREFADDIRAGKEWCPLCNFYVHNCPH